jgi:uncharacterized protein (DUF2461 family)
MGRENNTGSSKSAAIFPKAAVQFFRELSRNNSKSWMDANRDRYRTGWSRHFGRCSTGWRPQPES